MTDDLGLPADVPIRLREVLARCARGGTAPSVAAMAIVMDAASEADVWAAIRPVEAWLAGQPPGEGSARIRAAMAVIRAHPQAWAMTKAVLAEAEHDRPSTTTAEDLAHWAGVFDRAVRVSPEGSVALYSLGDPDLLRAATEEVVACLQAWDLLGRDRAMLDLGCGIGRFEAALAARMRLVVGVDISLEMLRVARQRCADLADASFARIAGHDLSMFADARFDLVLAADVFPYLIQSGDTVVQTQIAETARVLKPGGHLLILNLSYRDDVDADRRDVAALAHRCGLTVARSGTRDLQLWDALSFHLVKAT